MRYDRDYRAEGTHGPQRRTTDRRRRAPTPEPDIHDQVPERPARRRYGMGYQGGALRSRGSYQAGQLRSGMNPDDAFEFEWGGGYVGGRGYGGTNYDLTHGYRSSAAQRAAVAARGSGDFAGVRAATGATREPPADAGSRLFGPARYGYGPYYRRLHRRRRPDEEVREEVEETLYYDTWVDADRIRVEVEEGIVTLHGTLPNYDEVRFAVDDAWDVDGVRGVRSELRVGDAAAAGPAADAGARADASP